MAILAAGLAPVALSPRHAPAQPAPPLINPVAPAGQPLDLDALVTATLEQDRAQLLRGPDREEAAKRLIGRQSAAADEVIRTVLADRSNPAAQTAIAKAVAEDPTPDPQLVNTLVRLLGLELGQTRDVSAALAGYRDPPAGAAAGDARAALERYVKANPNPDPQSATRAAAVRGMAGAADKDAAHTLIDLLSDAGRPKLIRDAAADALADMTRLRENGRDKAAWQKWWAANQNKPADQFRADLLDRFRREQAVAAATNEALLVDMYRNFTAADKKGDALLRYMSDPNPAVRAIGVRLANRDMTSTGRDPGGAKPVLPRVQAMIGDSAAEVRAEVAAMLGAINDRPSLNALLTQLRQEPDPTVKIALLKAVQSMQDPRAVPQMINLLRDPSGQVQTAAAAALGESAPVIRGDPALKAAVVRALQVLMNGPGKAADGADVRAAGADALGRLADPKAPDPALRALFLGLLDRGEAKQTRQAALRGLAALGDPRTADAIVQWLAKEEPTVRLTALEALSAVGTFAYADAVFQYTQPNVERDPSVNEQAFKTITALARTADEGTLQQWIDTKLNPPNGRRDIDHQIPLLLVLADKYLAAGRRDEHAGTLENIGDRYMKATNQRPDQAAKFFDQALRYWLGRNSQPLVTQQLMKEEVEALLKAKQYADAARFAEEMTKANRINEPVVAAPLANEAESMMQARDAKGVQSLVSEAMKINPPLSEPYRGRLLAAKAEADRAVPRPPP